MRLIKEFSEFNDFLTEEDISNLKDLFWDLSDRYNLVYLDDISNGLKKQSYSIVLYTNTNPDNIQNFMRLSISFTSGSYMNFNKKPVVNFDLAKSFIDDLNKFLLSIREYSFKIIKTSPYVNYKDHISDPWEYIDESLPEELKMLLVTGILMIDFRNNI